MDAVIDSNAERERDGHHVDWVIGPAHEPHDSEHPYDAYGHRQQREQRGDDTAEIEKNQEHDGAQDQQATFSEGVTGDVEQRLCEEGGAGGVGRDGLDVGVEPVEERFIPDALGRKHVGGVLAGSTDEASADVLGQVGERNSVQLSLTRQRCQFGSHVRK